MSDAHDALVVGSGPNGLAAAIRLAEAGRSVLVLEAAEQPGGAVRTEELTLPGFHHDTFSSVYPATAASPVFARMPLHEHGLEWVHPAACYAHPLPDGEAAVLYRDLDAHRAEPRSPAPRRRRALGGLRGAAARRLRRRARHHALGLPAHRRPAAAAHRRRAARRTLNFARLLPESAVGLARRLFESGGSRAWLYGAAMHGDTPPEKPGGAIAAAYLNLLGHAVGWPSPARRRRTPDRRARRPPARARRRDPHRRDASNAVLATDGRVTGVAGRRRRALRRPHRRRRRDAARPRQAVPTSACPAGTARWCAATGSGRRRSRSTGRSTGPSRGATRRSAARAPSTSAAASPSSWTRSRESRSGLPERPFLLFGQQSVADPSRAPAGKHTAWAYTHGPQHGVDWRAEQDGYVERVEAQVERFAPGFRDRILARHVLGPADLSRATRTSSAATWAAAATACGRSSSGRCRRVSPYRTPLARAVPRQRRDVPGRRRPRRARRRRRARRAQPTGIAGGPALRAWSMTSPWPGLSREVRARRPRTRMSTPNAISQMLHRM